MKKQTVPLFTKEPRHHVVLKVFFFIVFLAIIGVTSLLIYRVYVDRTQLVTEKTGLLSVKDELSQQLDTVSAQLASVSAQLKTSMEDVATMKADDQYVKNKKLEEEIKNIQTSFQEAMKSYEEILELRDDGAKTQPLEKEFALVLNQLSKRNYTDAVTTMQKLEKDIAALKVVLANTVGAIPANVKSSNTAPTSGYSRQVVTTDAGQFVVDILAADLNSTRVQVETASADDCGDNCPVGSLSDFVSRSGGFAGINGPYFCPAEYPSCAGKTNSYDTLIMNKNKKYFNSDNNVYSVVPAMIFSGSSARLVNSSEAGRDGGVDAVIAGQPALVRGGEVAFGGDGDPKKGSRGSRCFIASKDNMVYIGVVRAATVAEVARVLKTLGVQSAINLDSGGTTAFMVNGKYIAGPGRQSPFGIVLVRK